MRVAGVYMHKSALYVRLTRLVIIIFTTQAIVTCGVRTERSAFTSGNTFARVIFSRH